MTATEANAIFAAAFPAFFPLSSPFFSPSRRPSSLFFDAMIHSFLLQLLPNYPPWAISCRTCRTIALRRAGRVAVFNPDAIWGVAAVEVHRALAVPPAARGAPLVRETICCRHLLLSLFVLRQCRAGVPPSPLFSVEAVQSPWRKHGCEGTRPAELISQARPPQDMPFALIFGRFNGTLCLRGYAFLSVQENDRHDSRRHPSQDKRIIPKLMDGRAQTGKDVISHIQRSFPIGSAAMSEQSRVRPSFST